MSFWKPTSMSTSRRQAFSTATFARSISARNLAASSFLSEGGVEIGRRSRRFAQVCHCLLQAGNFVLQPRDFLFERGAIFRHGLAGPAGAGRAASDIASHIIEAEEALIDAVEGVARRLRHGLLGRLACNLRPGRSRHASQSQSDDELCDAHVFPPVLGPPKQRVYHRLKSR